MQICIAVLYIQYIHITHTSAHTQYNNNNIQFSSNCVCIAPSHTKRIQSALHNDNLRIQKQNKPYINPYIHAHTCTNININNKIIFKCYTSCI